MQITDAEIYQASLHYYPMTNSKDSLDLSKAFRAGAVWARGKHTEMSTESEPVSERKEGK